MEVILCLSHRVYYNLHSSFCCVRRFVWLVTSSVYSQIPCWNSKNSPNIAGIVEYNSILFSLVNLSLGSIFPWVATHCSLFCRLPVSFEVLVTTTCGSWSQGFFFFFLDLLLFQNYFEKQRERGGGVFLLLLNSSHFTYALAGPS